MLTLRPATPADVAAEVGGSGHRGCAKAVPDGVECRTVLRPREGATLASAETRPTTMEAVIASANWLSRELQRRYLAQGRRSRRQRVARQAEAAERAFYSSGVNVSSKWRDETREQPINCVRKDFGKTRISTTIWRNWRGRYVLFSVRLFSESA